MKKSFIHIKADARESLLGNYSPIISATLFLAIVTALVSVPFTRMLYANPGILQYIIYYAAQLLIFALAAVFRSGIWRMHLKAARQQPFEFREFAFAVKSRPNRFLNAGLILAVLSLVFQLPTEILASINLAFYQKNHSLNLTFLAALAAVAALSLILGIYVYLRCCLVLLFLADHEQMECREAFGQSSRAMKGKKAKMFLMLFSFIGLILLGILTLFIGYLWIIPYMRQSITCFYTSLNDKEASQA